MVQREGDPCSESPAPPQLSVQHRRGTARWRLRVSSVRLAVSRGKSWGCTIPASWKASSVHVWGALKLGDCQWPGTPQERGEWPQGVSSSLVTIRVSWTSFSQPPTACFLTYSLQHRPGSRHCSRHCYRAVEKMHGSLISRSLPSESRQCDWGSLTIKARTYKA